MKKSTSFIFFIFLLFISQNLLSQTCGSRQLDARIAFFFKMIGYQDLTIEQLRSLPIEQIKSSFAPPPLPYPGGDVTRIKITKDSIPVLIFNPLHKTDLPIIINYHGGGFVSPLLPGLEYSLWQEAKNFEAILFSIDYRVAPEHRYPAAVNDCYNSFVWIANHGNKYGGDTSRIVLSGNSAGANLVAVVTQKAKINGISKKIKLQVMNGLPADLTPANMESAVSYQENSKGYFQTKAACYFAVEMYAPGQYNNPEVSPMLRKDLSGLPPAVIINTEFDPLRDDGIRYAARLRSSGVKVWDKCFAGLIHCLIGLKPGAPELKEYEALVKTAMKEVLPAVTKDQR